MTDECMSPLRRRMIEDMTVRNFVAKTQSDYILGLSASDILKFYEQQGPAIFDQQHGPVKTWIFTRSPKAGS